MGRRISKKGLTKKLDELWAELVKQEAGYKCEVCGTTQNLNSHHIEGRTNRRLRWELYNGVCACAGCHVFRKDSFHKSHIWAEKWLKENRGEDCKLIQATRNEIKKWTMDEMLELREEFEESI